MIFTDPKARMAWKLFRIRTQLLLRPLSRQSKFEIWSDLEAHVKETIQHSSAGSEQARLVEALDRLGDPREFLGPLVVDALTRGARVPAGLVGRLRHGVDRLLQRLSRMAGWISLLLVTVFGAGLGIVGIGSLVAPTRIGLFQLAPGYYQLRVVGLHGFGGTPLLPAVTGILAVLIGVGIARLAVGALRDRVAALLVAKS